MFYDSLTKLFTKPTRMRTNRRGRGDVFAVESLENRSMLAATTLAQIGGVVFQDNDSSGTLSGGDTRFNNALVRLYSDSNANSTWDGGDTLLSSQNSNSTGEYAFGNLSSGNYFVVQPTQSIGSVSLSQKVSALISVSAANASGVQGVFIDEFTSATTPATTDDFPPGTPVEEVFTAADAIGNQRDLRVSYDSGPAGTKVEMRSDGFGKLRINPDDDVQGTYVVTWDGVDTANTDLVAGLQPTGLGGVDLTAVGGESGRGTGICFPSITVDHPGGSLTLQVYTDATHFSEAVISSLPDNVDNSYFIPFTGTNAGIGFVAAGAAGGADFTNVGAIRLIIDSTQDAMDGSLEVIGVLAPTLITNDIVNDAPVPSIDVEKLTNGSQADLISDGDVPTLVVGAAVTWTYRVTNDGQADLTNVTLVDDQEGTITNITQRLNGNSDNILEPGETWVYETTGTALAGNYENKATVTAIDDLDTEVMDMDFSHYIGVSPSIDIEKFTNGNQADNAADADVPTITVGSSVTWLYRVTNTGQADLSNVTVTDNIQGAVTTIINRLNGDTDNILEPGEIWEYQLVGTAVAGSYANTGTVTGLSAAGQQVTDSDPSHYVGVTPSIDIEKFTNGNQADLITDADVPTIPVGSSVTWLYRVTNTGQADLNNVVVTDNQIGTVSTIINRLNGDSDSVLEPGEIWEYQAIGTAQAGQYENSGTVVATAAGGQQVTDVDLSHYIGASPAINLIKYVEGLDADTTGSGPQIFVGSSVTFTYVVENTGSLELTNVVVSDDNGTSGNTTDDFFATYSSGDTDVDGVLDVDETWTFTATRTAVSGTYTNIGRVTANSSGGQVLSDTNPANYQGIPLPALTTKRRFLASS